MLLKDINPFVRQALVASLNSSNRSDTFNELQSSDCRLFYILSDHGSIVIGGKRYDLHYGCVILFQSSTKYMWEIEFPNEIKYISVNFDYTHRFSNITRTFHPAHSSLFKETDALENIHFEDAAVLNHPIVIERLTSFENRMKLLATEFYIGNDYCDELLSSIIKSLIIHIVRIENGSSGANGKNVLKLTGKIIEYIQNNYTHPLTNTDIAQHFHINPVYMNRIFKQQTGRSVHSFILNYRLNAAMVILRSGSVSVQETALMVGFSDPVHFNKIFKKHIGTTPNRYRNSKE